MSTENKVLDLIYLDGGRHTEIELKSDYRARINLWKNWLGRKQEESQEGQNTFVEEQNEYFMLENVLKNFISKRLDWIEKTVNPPELRKKYLMLLPPFYQDKKVKDFIFHFFQIKEEGNDKKLTYYFLNKSEKELRVLWDIYKLTRTIQSIDVIKKHLKKGDFHSSSFSRDQILDTISTLRKALTLLMKIFIKPEHYQRLTTNFSKEVFLPESVLERKETDRYLINDIILDKFDYRNYFFSIYFRPYIKAIYANTEYTYEFNYLDYEIIRQEFLIDWMHRRLSGNAQKRAIFDNYFIGKNSFNDVIQKNPKMEITLLKRIPKDKFNDLIAHVNDAVEDDNLLLEIDPMSERSGEFSKLFQTFETVRNLTQTSIAALKTYIIGKKQTGTVPKQKEERVKKEVDANKEEEPRYQVHAIKNNEISFPFFSEKNSEFRLRYSLLQGRMDTSEFNKFNKVVGETLGKMSESQLIKRHTPRHEWAVPYIFTEKLKTGTNAHLLILGAEVKSKPLGMGYSSSMTEEYTFSSYFVYGSQEIIPEMGTPIEKRIVRNTLYHIYPYQNKEMFDKVVRLSAMVTRMNHI